MKTLLHYLGVFAISMIISVVIVLAIEGITGWETTMVFDFIVGFGVAIGVVRYFNRLNLL